MLSYRSQTGSSLGQAFKQDRSTSDISTWSPKAMEIAKQWLASCVANHPDCSKKRWPVFSPTWLIDMGLDASKITPRLIATSTLQDHPRCISLSHCWGGNISTMLLKRNLKSMSEGFSLEDLPLTFQHALQITQAFGCRYIWIDSFCIIQDSPEDWVKESTQMHQVHANAY